jgi:hypothetical protein
VDCARVVRVTCHWYIHSLFFVRFGTKAPILLGDGPHYFHFFHCLSDIYKTNNMRLSGSSTLLTSPPIYERPMTKPTQLEDLQLRVEPSTIDIADKLLGLEHTFDPRIVTPTSTPTSTHHGQERTVMFEMTQTASQMTHLRILLSEKQMESLRDGITTPWRALEAPQCFDQVETYPDGDRSQDDRLRLSKNDCLTATLVVALNLSQSRMCMSQTPSRDSDSTVIPSSNHIAEAATLMNVSEISSSLGFTSPFAATICTRLTPVPIYHR